MNKTLDAIKEDAIEEKKQSFFEHLLELRACLIKALIFWVIFSILVYIFAKEIIDFLTKPLYQVLPSQEQQVFFKTFPEVFGIYIKLSIILGFVLGSPFIFYQLWLFIAPGLYAHERKWVKSAVFLTCCAFLIGDLIAYYIFLPFIIKFFYSFGEQFLVFKPFLKEYISFVLKIFIIFGVIFQVPILLILLRMFDFVTYEELKKFRPYAVILSFVISAILTTGFDPLNQIILALPLTLLYEIGIILTKVIEIKKGGKKCFRP